MPKSTILNPHDLYPLNPHRYNVNACNSSLTRDPKPHVNRPHYSNINAVVKLSTGSASSGSSANQSELLRSANSSVGPLRVRYPPQAANRAHVQQATGSNSAGAQNQNNNFIFNNNINQLIYSNQNNNRLNVSMLLSFI